MGSNKLHEPGEWALIVSDWLGDLVLSFIARDVATKAEDWSVLLPVWVELEVVIHALMSEEELLVSKLGGGELGVKDDVSKVGCDSIELLWCIQSIHLEQGGAWLDAHQLLCEWVVLIVWEIGSSSWLKSELPWESLIRAISSRGSVLLLRLLRRMFPSWSKSVRRRQLLSLPGNCLAS